jgi:acyl-CoA synthetase (AMP-forming)/AMP-acid ligase II
MDPPTPETIARHVESGVWQRRRIHAIVDDRAGDDPDREAAVDQTRRLTYAELVAASNSVARFLLDAGVRDGDCVAIQSPNRVELAVVHLACSRVGATFVPLSHAWRRTELRHLLGVSRAVVAIVPGDMLGAVPELPHLRLVHTLDDLGDVLATPADHVDDSSDPNLPRYVMVSSGTTSLPKLSLWSDNNLWYFGEVWSRAVALSFKDRVVGLAPAGTGAVGYVYGVLFPLLRGATSILLERWDAVEAIGLLERERATLATAVPTQIVKLLEQPGLEWADVARLRAVTNAGAPMPPAAAERLEVAWGCRIQTVYGATDGGVPLMTTIDDPAAKRRTSVGRPLPFTDLRIVDGELQWRGPTKSFGYLNDPARTAEAFTADGHYRSGDLAEADGDGYFRIVGRAKDMIIRGGQNISPREVEEAVGSHPAISEVLAVGVPDEVYGERVCVAVTLRDGAQLDLGGLTDFLAGLEVARFKVPERLEVLSELPKTASGKLSRAEVLKRIGQGSPSA